MKVLVTGLFEPAAVHSIRRLGEIGHDVVAAEGHRLAYAAFSKHVTGKVRLPNMRHFPREYAEALLRELESGKYDYYFPCYEELILMSHYRDRVVAATKTAMPDTATLMTLHDKEQLGVLAGKLGIDSPRTLTPRSLAEADEIMGSVELPVVIKMRKSSGAAGMRKIYDRATFKKAYDEVVRVNKLAEDELPMIQELIQGPTTCTLHLCNRGEVIGEVMYQGVRTMPRTGGTTVCRETMADPACQAAAAKIVKHLRYTGFCGFDFVIQEGTGKPFVVDGNCRITPAIAMAYHGGCDMIPAWLEVADGGTPAKLPETRVGTRTKMGFGDFVWLLESYLGSFKDWSGERRQRKLWWADRGVPDDISSRKDPMPIIMLWVYIFANLWKLVFTDFDSAQLFIFHNQYVGDPQK